jgi:hypothetical protein
MGTGISILPPASRVLTRSGGGVYPPRKPINITCPPVRSDLTASAAVGRPITSIA